MRSRAAALLGLALAASVALGPFGVTLHAADHLVHASPLRYEQHDDAAHCAHHPPDLHLDCGLCAYHKSARALAATAPHAAPIGERREAPVPLVARWVGVEIGRLLPPRAPPSTSLTDIV